VITPRLYRRSLGHAFQVRLLLLYVVGSLIPAIFAAMPLRRVLSNLLDHSPRAKDLVAALDSHAAIDILRQFGDAQTSGSVATGFATAIVAALLVGPFLAGAALLVAREEVDVHAARREWRGGGEELTGPTDAGVVAGGVRPPAVDVDEILCLASRVRRVTNR